MVDAVLGDEAVDDVEDCVAVVFVEGVELVDAICDGGVGWGERVAGGVTEEEVVAGGVEGFGDADEGVEAGGDLAGFVAADALAVGADEFAEVGLRPAGFGSEGSDAVAESHGVGVPGVVVWVPLCNGFWSHVILHCVP